MIIGSLSFSKSTVFKIALSAHQAASQRFQISPALCARALRYWQTRTHCCGNIVAHDVSLRAQTGKNLLRTQNVSEQNQKHFCVPGTKFVSATNVERAGKRGNICVGNKP